MSYLFKTAKNFGKSGKTYLIQVPFWLLVGYSMSKNFQNGNCCQHNFLNYAVALDSRTSTVPCPQFSHSN
jgi:hypothetical protein